MKQFSRIVFVSFLLVVLGAWSVSAQEDHAQRNKQIYLETVAQYNAGNREAFYGLLTDPFMMNQGDPTLASMSPDDVRAYDSALAAAMPDIQMTPAVVIAQGDWVRHISHGLGHSPSRSVLPHSDLMPSPPTIKASLGRK